MHYLARMIEAGEDPRFIARRLVISASEDIGMGDPTALGVAVAAAEAVQLIGMPEARINLAQAVVALALAPKSNAVIMAVDAAIADVKAGKVGPVPPHLRDAHYAGAKKIGHGSSYQYSHNDPRGIVPQQYAPDVDRRHRLLQAHPSRRRGGVRRPRREHPQDPPGPQIAGSRDVHRCLEVGDARLLVSGDHPMGRDAVHGH